jgi:hypothetical protein
VELVEEAARREILELGLAALHRRQGGGAVGLGEPVEVLAVGLAGVLVGGDHAGREILARRQRELVALLGLAFVKRPGSIHLGASGPGRRHLTVDEDIDAAGRAGW